MLGTAISSVDHHIPQLCAALQPADQQIAVLWTNIQNAIAA